MTGRSSLEPSETIGAVSSICSASVLDLNQLTGFSRSALTPELVQADTRNNTANGEATITFIFKFLSDIPVPDTRSVTPATDFAHPYRNVKYRADCRQAGCTLHRRRTA